MNCCGKAGSSVSISGNGGERLKAQAEAAVRALDNNNNNNQVATGGEFERLVKKNGELNVSFPHKYWAPCHFFRMDKILEMSWFSFILMWAAVFTTDFIIAGATFDGLQKYHERIHANDDEKKMCYSGVDGFMTAILFAFETAQTIGYGSRYPMANCPAGIMLTLIHIVVTTLLATLFGGSFLAKFANNSPDAALMFSQKALITSRNGELFFVIRIADPTESGFDFGAEVFALAVTHLRGVGKEACPIKLETIPIGCQLNGSGSRVPLMWPATVSHRIDMSSPLYGFTPEQLADSHMEVIVNVVGEHGSGASIDSRTSYIGNEIVWGARFIHSSVTLCPYSEGYLVSFTQEEIDRFERITSL